MYQQYLILFAEITRNKKALFLHEGEELEIQEPKDGVWILTLPVLSFEGKIPSKVAECLFSCSLQAFQIKGPQLQKEGQKIILRLVTRTPTTFSGFQKMIKTLDFQVKEWRETLRELSRQSPSKLEKQALFFAY